MARPSLEQVGSWCGRTVVDADGARIGTMTDVYVQAETDDPLWGLVEVGQFGVESRFVPLLGAVDRGELTVPYPRAIIVAAPDVQPDEALSADDERALYRHYGLQAVSEPPERATEAAVHEPAARQPQADAGADVVRSEEELHVDTRPARRVVRLKKNVVTDYVTRQIPVRREQVRLVEEPATGDAETGDRVTGAPAGETPEVTLHEEQPVIETRVVPTERVRLTKETVVGQEQVSDELRKEQIEVTGTNPEAADEPEPGPPGR